MPQAFAQLLADSRDFALAVLSTYVTLLTGGAIIATVWVWEHRRRKAASWRFSRLLLAFLLLTATFLAWREQHATATKALTEEKAKINELQERDRRITALLTNLFDLQGNLNAALSSKLYPRSDRARVSLVAPAHKKPSIRVPPSVSAKPIEKQTGSYTFLSYDLDGYCKAIFAGNPIGDIGNPSYCLVNGISNSVQPGDVCFWLYGSHHFSQDPVALLPYCDTDERVPQPCSTIQRPCGSDPALCCAK